MIMTNVTTDTIFVIVVLVLATEKSLTLLVYHDVDQTWYTIQNQPSHSRGNYFLAEKNEL